MKKIYTLGILSGMGPYSTAPFLNNIFDACKKLYGAKSDLDFPHMVIYSLPTPYHPEDNVYDDRVIQCLKIGITSLIKAGAKIIAVPCNSIHQFYNDMKKISTVPILNIIDETLSKIQNNNNTICILATRSTINANLYQSKLAALQKKIFWSNDLQKQVDRLVASFKSSGVNQTTLSIWKEIKKVLYDNNVKEVIIGCTDLFFCAGQSQKLKFYDSSIILAESLVKKYMAHLAKQRDILVKC